ncbi:YfjI family protein [Aeromonas veronii]|uniref:YfjI family protein n=1 Tax=Aeromonas veronii TaxID=654 RepID=UPI003BA210A8
MINEKGALIFRDQPSFTEILEAANQLESEAQRAALAPVGFPVSALSEQLQAVIRGVKKQTQASEELIGCMLIGMMVPAVHDLFVIKPLDNMSFPLSASIMVVAGSGEGKSSVAKCFLKSIRTLESDLAMQYQTEMAQFAGELEHWEIKHKVLKKGYQRAITLGEEEGECKRLLDEHMASKPTKPVQKRLLVNDLTTAGLLKLLGTGWPSLFLFSDEAGSILDNELFHKPHLLNTLWDEQCIRVDRGGSHAAFSIDNARFSSLLMTQPASFHRMLKQQRGVAITSGLCARLLICAPKSTMGERLIGDAQEQQDEVERASLEWFSQRQAALLMQSMARREAGYEYISLQLSAEARTLLYETANAVTLRLDPQGDLHQYRNFGAKYFEHVARIAGVLEAFCTGGKMVSTATVRAAITIVDYFFKQHIHLMADDVMPSMRTHAEELDAWLKKRAGSQMYFEIPKNEILQKALVALRSVAVLDKAIDELMAKNKVRLRSEYRHQGHKPIMMVCYYNVENKT